MASRIRYANTFAHYFSTQTPNISGFLIGAFAPPQSPFLVLVELNIFWLSENTHMSAADLTATGKEEKKLKITQRDEFIEASIKYG